MQFFLCFQLNSIKYLHYIFCNFYEFDYNHQQKLLDKKITDANFYTGVKGTSDIGYLGYNCHNQFVQILLQGGIFLMLIFIFLIWSIFKESVFFKPILIFLLLFMLSESVLQTQAGMMLFVFAILISTLYHPEGKHANP